jgi:hypothetical protein
MISRVPAGPPSFAFKPAPLELIMPRAKRPGWASVRLRPANEAPQGCIDPLG